MCQSGKYQLHQLMEVINAHYKEKSVVEQKACIFAGYLLNKTVRAKNEDILAGWIKKNNAFTTVSIIKDLADELEIYKRDGILNQSECNVLLAAEDMGMFTRSPGGHLIPGYDSLIIEGIQAKLKRIKEFYQKNYIDNEKQQFYKAEYIAVKSFQQMILRYEKAYREIGQEELSELLRHIAYEPASTFKEAVQMVLLAHEAVIDESEGGSISFGRFDQYLYPYYLKDINDGTLNSESAYEIIRAFWLKVSEAEKSWQNVTIGGSSIDGEDSSNEITFMCIRAAGEIRRDQPQLSLRVCEKTPNAIWQAAMRLIQKGLGFPALFNDATVIKAKENVGISHEDAVDYGIVGCVETSSGGKEYSHTEACRINLMKLMELMLNGGVCPITQKKYPLCEKHNLEEIKDFKEFNQWYKAELENYIDMLCTFLDKTSDCYGKNRPAPFSSCIMSACLTKGRDVTREGAVYNNLTINFVGTASVADALEAIEKGVFFEKASTLTGMRDILNKNFVGHESLRQKLLEYPKYGNGIASVDEKVTQLTRIITDKLRNLEMNKRHGHYQAGFYSSFYHATMADKTGASADGRKRGEALSSSLSPSAGMDKKGPTGVINSVSGICMDDFGNGMALDLKFVRPFFDKQVHVDGLISLIKYYFSKGGMEIQLNVVDRDTLIDAKAHPEQYRNLVVRVSGFSAYFTELEDNLQDEIIKRTEHGA